MTKVLRSSRRMPSNVLARRRLLDYGTFNTINSRIIYLFKFQLSSFDSGREEDLEFEENAGPKAEEATREGDGTIGSNPPGQR
jgi:hypothetical protein